MNKFGGEWTEQKIEIVLSYAKAYLTIMNKYPYWKIMYFDGFAGSGHITNDYKETEGAALRILSIDQPKSFNEYYFVELDTEKSKSLEEKIKKEFPNKTKYVVQDDCNKKLHDLAFFLKKPQNKNYRLLAFIDPYGMALKWNSIETLKELGIDMWMLVPTGIGVGRLLKNDGNISDAWLSQLESFLGISREEIKDYFYKSQPVSTLFGLETLTKKEDDTIGRIAKLYKKRLEEVFKFVASPLELKNSKGVIMYHFFFASNNPYALSIANDIIKTYKNG